CGVTTMMDSPPRHIVESIVSRALAEDLGRAGDVTARACIPADARMQGRFAARSEGRTAGLDCVTAAVPQMDPAADIRMRASDGDDAAPGAVLVEVEAGARALLAAERTALNLLGRLCGTATLTRAFVRAVEGTGVRITDTRKTTPGLRTLEKHAVLCG